MKKTNKELYLFYDGKCRVCAWEIQHYKSKDQENKLGLIDISDPSFNPEDYGKTQEDFDRYFHVQTKSGELLEGVQAFKKIWDTLGLMQIPSKLYEVPVANKVMDLSYVVFARHIRPLLPKKKDSCSI